LKKEMAALEPSHALAHVEKKEKKKKAKAAAKEETKEEAETGEVSKNEAKKAAKKAAKKEKAAQHKAAEQHKTAEQEDGGEAVYFSAAIPPVVSVAAAFGTELAFRASESGQPVLRMGETSVFGDLAIARFALRRRQSELLGGNAVEEALIDQWVDFSLSYPAVGDLDSLAKVVDERLERSTYLVADRLTLADIAVWAVLRSGPSLLHIDRWRKLCEAQPAVAHAAKGPPKGPPAKGPAHKPAAKKQPLKVEETPQAEHGDGCPPLVGGEVGKVVTRFPPEPSGYLHIGHAKAVLLNDYYARRYEGKLLVRFDDTNPSKEKEEFAASIIADLETLGIDCSNLSHTSDHFEAIRGYAERLLDEGKAFMDDSPQETMKAEREQRVESRHRNASIETNKERFAAMCAGDAPEWCLRAKIDMTSDNGTLRDPVLFRANATPHHRTGTRYKAYPTYDMACPVVDSIEGVTHALRTTEYNDRDAQYAWLQEAMGLRKVEIQAFSRINFVRTLMSKRKLAWLVDNGVVDGWDDPRFPTIQGVVRRGVSVAALRDFMVSQGASRNVINLEWDAFWATNKAAYEPTAPRYMAVDKTNRKLTLTNLPDYERPGQHFITAPLVPKDPSLGTRPIRVSTRVVVELDDAIAVGEQIVLIRWGVFELVSQDENGDFQARFVPDGSVKKKKTVHWLADVPELCAVTLLEYDYLIAKPKLEDGDDLADPGVLTPVSKVETPAFADPAVKTLRRGAVVQLERRGFFRVDHAYDGTLAKLILIPDGKVKAPFSRLPAAAHS